MPTDAPNRSAGGQVVIVGAGLAGLFTALKLAPMPVTVISAAAFGHGTSSGWAQGGIAAAIAEGDTPEAHAADTIRAGAGIVDDEIALGLAREAPDRIEDLLAYGVPFDRDLEGRLKLSREAAHGARRIVRVKGDLAGRAIMNAVVQAALEAPSITVLEGWTALDLDVEDGEVRGVLLWPTGSDGSGTPERLSARATVLASGGIGQLFAITSNPGATRGDGIAMAARAGAVIADAEFVQFHPTALDVGRDPAPLATEALRGEGATLINRHGERFMTALHPDAELAPRDIVARAVFSEISSGRGAWLDCRAAIGDRVTRDFPGLAAKCGEVGLDPARDPLPVAPAAHYHMGGVATDARGRTNVPGLWAAGEVASTGAHGANRLASNSLLETVVFGARIAADITGDEAARRGLRAHLPAASPTGGATDWLASLGWLRQEMTRNVGVMRNGAGLTSALGRIIGHAGATGLPVAAQNMLLAARFVTQAALEREESRGGHYRTDYPEPRPDLAHRSRISLSQLERNSSDHAPTIRTLAR